MYNHWTKADWIGWWGARCGEVLFISAAGVGIYFGFRDYVVCFILYGIFLRVSSLSQQQPG